MLLSRRAYFFPYSWRRKRGIASVVAVQVAAPTFRLPRGPVIADLSVISGICRIADPLASMRTEAIAGNRLFRRTLLQDGPRNSIAMLSLCNHHHLPTNVRMKPSSFDRADRLQI
ncbi:hypothetical protein SCHPADRAFT_503220 [Schizopora paradoxa]|uniref:Uncharacterized protein n=1 Tax=Schizopora paradoxa TaxID=27342 RepID=A0A0H2RGT6_9AGAM|nr:hypothetical protein SCHPADRAFT_503220 [Schizopora paradoxa]